LSDGTLEAKCQTPDGSAAAEAAAHSVTRRDGNQGAHRIEELADFELEAIGVRRQRLRRQHLPGGWTGSPPTARAVDGRISKPKVGLAGDGVDQFDHVADADGGL
jgi:hypothetical protein